MCGRFTLTVDPAELKESFDGYIFPTQFAPRFNIAPTQPVLAIPNDAKNRADFFLWGLIPSWSKDPTIANKLINARGETLAEKPSFRGGFKYKRCMILADGFYEWKTNAGEKNKTPYFIHMKDRNPFALAGLWDEWHSPDGASVRTCTIITTEPNELMSTLHNRMPVILDPKDYAQWLDPAPQPPDRLQHLIRPFPADRMSAHPVSTLVNKPENDRPELVVPLQ
ncbi:MAG TPA: SOS response-associated peptidase [Anaerolineales bacterium]|nr:SOS response-associated peptidase [Anaerolineales bacterium]HNN13528.1 SOS response-associated peptidase [Anaerolineales bacterium]HNO32287.1 SOS response-associated peptidase [Anaerolineales bacterium]